MIPLELHLIALVQLLTGLSAGVNALVRLSHGEIFLDLGVCGIPAYFGLLRRDPHWRGWTACSRCREHLAKSNRTYGYCPATTIGGRIDLRVA